MSVSQDAIVFLLKIQMEYVTKSYHRQIVEQMYSYYGSDDNFNLLSLL